MARGTTFADADFSPGRMLPGFPLNARDAVDFPFLGCSCLEIAARRGIDICIHDVDLSKLRLSEAGGTSRRKPTQRHSLPRSDELEDFVEVPTDGTPTADVNGLGHLTGSHQGVDLGLGEPGQFFDLASTDDLWRTGW
jgi:hypothetical protein